MCWPIKSSFYNMHCHFLQVSSALNDEIRRLCIVVDEFDRPFHPDPILLNNYKKVNLKKMIRAYIRIVSLYNITCDTGFAQVQKYLNLESSLEKSLKIKSALKRIGKSLRSLEKSLNSTIFYRTYTVNRELNQYEIVVPLFGAAYWCSICCTKDRHNNFILIFQY